MASSKTLHEVASGLAGPSPVLRTKVIVDEFVNLIEDNPKVWAVYAIAQPSGINLWTFVDSDSRNDRSAIYAAEWQLMTHFPEVAFDFNVLLSPAGYEQFEPGASDYLYIR